MRSLRLDCQVTPPRRLRQPWLRLGSARRKAKRRLGTSPRQRHPAAVAARIRAAGPVPDRVLAPVVWDVLDLPEAEFLTLVNVDRARQGHGEQRGRPGTARAEFY